MTLSGILFLVVGLFTLTVNIVIAAVMLRDPNKGLETFTHRPEQLPEVMTGRYLVFVILTLLTLIYGDPVVLMGLLVAFAFAAMADTFIYARRGFAYVKHLAAGIACGVGIAILAFATGGAG